MIFCVTLLCHAIVCVTLTQSCALHQQVYVRSYAVRTEDGRLFRRNRKHLRQSQEPFMSKDADVEIPSLIRNCPPTESNTEPAPTESSTGNPTPSKQTDLGPQTIRPASPAKFHKSSAVTRSGRSIRPLAT